MCEKCGASKPRSPRTYTDNISVAAIFCVVTFSSERLIRLLVPKERVVSEIGPDFFFFFGDELRVGVAGLRREKQHRHGVVNRWILTSVWDRAAVALAVTEGMNHKKYVYFSSFSFIYAPTYIVRETCVALNRDL